MKPLPCETEYVSNPVIIPSDFVGDWLNEDPDTAGITRIEITQNGNELGAHEWGACTPEDCDWGIEYTPLENEDDGILNLFWDQEFVERTQELEIIEPDRLRATTFSHYVDDSGRSDVTTVYYFTK